MSSTDVSDQLEPAEAAAMTDQLLPDQASPPMQLEQPAIELTEQPLQEEETPSQQQTHEEQTQEQPQQEQEPDQEPDTPLEPSQQTPEQEPSQPSQTEQDQPSPPSPINPPTMTEQPPPLQPQQLQHLDTADPSLPLDHLQAQSDPALTAPPHTEEDLADTIRQPQLQSLADDEAMAEEQLQFTIAASASYAPALDQYEDTLISTIPSASLSSAATSSAPASPIPSTTLVARPSSAVAIGGSNAVVEASVSSPLPSFASASARALDATIQKSRAKLFNTVDLITNTQQRISIMKEHLNQVQKESVHTLDLITNKQADVRTSQHLGSVSERYIGTLQTDLSNMKKEIKALQESDTALAHTKVSLGDRLNQYQTSMNFSMEQLLQWALLAKQQLEDYSLLQSYSHADTKLLHSLRSSVDAQVETVIQKQQQLLATETRTNELMISTQQLQQEYTSQHQQKIKILNDWNSSVLSMYNIDKKIMEIGEAIIKQRLENDRQQSLNEEQRQFVAQEAANVKKVNSAIDENQRQNVKKRTEWTNKKETIISMEEEVITKRNIMEKAEGEVNKQKNQYVQLMALKEDKAKKLTSIQEQYSTSEKSLQTEIAALKDIHSQFDSLSKQLNSLQEQYDSDSNLLIARKQQLFQLNESLTQKRLAEQHSIIEIENYVSTSKNLYSKITALDVLSVKQQEMLYQCEFIIQTLERKLNQSIGKLNDGEMEIYKKIKEELMAAKQKEASELGLMLIQVKKLNDESRLMAKEKLKLVQQLSDKQQLTQSLSVEISSLQRNHDQLTEEQNALLLQHDRQKNEVMKLRERWIEQQSLLYKSEQVTIELDLLIKQRQLEISQYEEVEGRKFRFAADDRNNLSREVKEKQREIDILKKKYAILQNKRVVGGESLGSTNDEAGEHDDGKSSEVSQGYYIVAAGLALEEQRRRQEELKGELVKVEREIEGVYKIILELEVKQQRLASSAFNSSVDGQKLQELHVTLQQYEAEVYQLDIQLRTDIQREEQAKMALARLISSLGTVIQQIQAGQEEIARLQQQKDKAEQVLHRANRSCDHQYKQLQELRATASKPSKPPSSASPTTTSPPRPSPRQQQHEEEKTTLTEAPTPPMGLDAALLETGIRLSEQRGRTKLLKELLADFVASHLDVQESAQSIFGELLLWSKDDASSVSSSGASSASSSRPSSSASVRSVGSREALASSRSAGGSGSGSGSGAGGGSGGGSGGRAGVVSVNAIFPAVRPSSGSGGGSGGGNGVIVPLLKGNGGGVSGSGGNSNSSTSRSRSSSRPSSQSLMLDARRL